MQSCLVPAVFLTCCVRTTTPTRSFTSAKQTSNKQHMQTHPVVVHNFLFCQKLAPRIEPNKHTCDLLRWNQRYGVASHIRQLPHRKVSSVFDEA